MIRNYESQYNFLNAIVNHASTANLREAARALMGSMDLIAEYRLNYALAAGDDFAKFLSWDVLAGQILPRLLKDSDFMELLNPLEHFGLSTIALANRECCLKYR